MLRPTLKFQEGRGMICAQDGEVFTGVPKDRQRIYRSLVFPEGDPFKEPSETQYFETTGAGGANQSNL